MSETEEEKKKRWAKNRALAYMTPTMQHAMAMSKYQSQNKYKEQFNKTKGKGYTQVSSTPELERVRQQSIRQSQTKYKSEFEKNKAKFTQVADDPETLRVRKVTNQVSKIAYEGRGSALAESKLKRTRGTPTRKESAEETGQSKESEEILTPKQSSSRHAEDQEKVDEKTHDEADASQDPEMENEQVEHDETDVKENSPQSYEEEPVVSQEHSQGTEEYNSPKENGEYHGEQTYTASQEALEQVYDTPDETNGAREYRQEEQEDPAPEGEHEYSEVGLDDFYANLG